MLAALIDMMHSRHQGFDILERPIANETNFANSTVTRKVGGFEI
ncbi:hypothetical protein GGE61_005730 [Rhizobium leguminosarum]|uniref:Uncharacterized protein n=1 Tax=Rhizobium johnstonii (strain DSM 114642 / LMG 32736 / 3841) TaxID=216596 RepID=Q1MI15_RHIJ3|nr:hypothetical protein [Rhizobium leguminosarum]MBB5261242.1 hypothetical protein [Rhizobium leguminosarum]CAK07395.1 hypothetical protein RL1901 [Rhizobium johnstonii 3841]